MCSAQGNDSMHHGARKSCVFSTRNDSMCQKFHVPRTWKRNIHVYNSVTVRAQLKRKKKSVLVNELELPTQPDDGQFTLSPAFDLVRKRKDGTRECWESGARHLPTRTHDHLRLLMSRLNWYSKISKHTNNGRTVCLPRRAGNPLSSLSLSSIPLSSRLVSHCYIHRGRPGQLWPACSPRDGHEQRP